LIESLKAFVSKKLVDTAVGEMKIRYVSSKRGTIGKAVLKVEALLMALPLCSTAFAQTVNLYDRVDPFI
jgi:hypothetical protein